MKFIKMLGIVTSALVVAMAVAGVSLALATPLEEVVLCKEQGVAQCPAGKVFPSGTVAHAELVNNTKAVLLGGASGDIECTEAKFLVTTGTTSLAHGEVTSLAINGCTWAGEECTATAENLNYLFKGELNAADNGYQALVTEKGANGVPRFRMVCGPLDCKFSSASFLFIAEPNVNDTVLKIQQAVNRVGFCPVAATWDAKYLFRCLESGSIELKPCWLQME